MQSDRDIRDKRIPIIIDCDNTMGVPGCDVDDGLAIIYLMQSEKTELIGITCEFGNSTQEAVYKNTLRFMKRLGREDIPVLRGADSACGDRASEAAAFLADKAAEHAGELIVVATGSMTNLLGAGRTDPGFFEKVRRFSIMGGITEALTVGGRAMAELNLSCDAEASYAVLQSGRVTIATAQNALESYFSADGIERRLTEAERTDDRRILSLCQQMRHDLSEWINFYTLRYGMPGFVNWDMMAAVLAVTDEFFDMEELVITPSTESLKTGMLRGGGPQVKVIAPKISDKNGYLSHVYDCICTPLQRQK